MSNLTKKFAPGITLFTQIIVSFLVEKYKYLSLTGRWFYKIGIRAKTVKNVIHAKLIYGHSLRAVLSCTLLIDN